MRRRVPPRTTCATSIPNEFPRRLRGHVRSPRRLVVDAEVYFGHGLSATLFAAAPRLRWVQSAAAGVASLLFPAMRASDVKLTNSAGVMADTIAEHLLVGVIYLLRSFDIAGFDRVIGPDGLER